MISITNLQYKEYSDLKDSGELFKLYPNATGDYDVDVKIPNKEQLNKIFKRTKEMHSVWHKFHKWLLKTYGKDLQGDLIKNKIKLPNGKTITFKYHNFNELEFSRRICGYEVIEKIEKYINSYCKEIKIVYCDDDHYATSIILLIPHPGHGISVMFIPQCTTIQNRFFLYGNHFKMLQEELEKMKYVYEKDVLL